MKKKLIINFSVRGQNKFGLGDIRETNPVIIKTPFKVPGCCGKPVLSNITKSNAVITWHRPENDGGSEVINYVVKKREKLGTQWIKCTSRQIPECRFKATYLQAGQQYEFQVQFSSLKKYFILFAFL